MTNYAPPPPPSPLPRRPPVNVASTRGEEGQWVEAPPPPAWAQPFVNPQQPNPFPGHYTPVGQGCYACGGYVMPQHRDIRRRRQLGFGWLTLIVCTAGLALPFYLYWRHTGEIVNVDRYNQCVSCGAQQ